MKLLIILIILSCFFKNILSQNNNAPEAVKLAFTQSKDSIRVTWFTNDEMKAPVVLYNTVMFNPENDDTQYFGTNAESEAYDLISGYKGYTSTAVINGLLPSIIYFYCVGDKSANIWSTIYNFTTRSDINTPNDQVISFSSAWYGDMGWMPGNSSDSDVHTVSNVLSISNELSFVTHVGDIAYADTTIRGNQTIWNLFQESITPLSTKLPYNVCPGNHDIIGYGLSVYRKTWQMPIDIPLSLWYSYDYNGVHFIGFSSESDYFPLSEQHIWIENDLKEYRKTNPNGWIVMYSHRPFYCSVVWGWCDSGNKTDVLKRLYIDTLEDLLYRYNVDLFISGHAHSYERSQPVYHSEIMGNYQNPKATVHIVVGTGGDREGEDKKWQPYQPWNQGIRTSLNGYGLLNIINSTTLNWQFIANQNNSMIEEFYLTKGQFN